MYGRTKYDKCVRSTEKSMSEQIGSYGIFLPKHFNPKFSNCTSDQCLSMGPSSFVNRVTIENQLLRGENLKRCNKKANSVQLNKTVQNPYVFERIINPSNMKY